MLIIQYYFKIRFKFRFFLKIINKSDLKYLIETYLGENVFAHIKTPIL